MKALLVLGLAAGTAACPGPTDSFPPYYKEALIDRFDAPHCSDTRFLEGGRNPNKRRPGGYSVFFASDDCVAQIKAAIAEMGWENTVRTEYRFESEQGWAEYVTFDATDKPDITLVKWELPDS